ncbi:hypothetical protein EPO56_01055 [Patescibacteria group bacterium]|nr:MAG: hypothetical protein EPO56_01055 [Patescibacteria group bacterium]
MGFEDFNSRIFNFPPRRRGLLPEQDSSFLRSESSSIRAPSRGNYESRGSRRTRFNTDYENASEYNYTTRSFLGATTLGAVDLLASGTAVVAGSILASGALHFPYTILVLGAPVVPGVLLPVTISVVGIGLIIIGMKRIGKVVKKALKEF